LTQVNSAAGGKPAQFFEQALIGDDSWHLMPSTVCPHPDGEHAVTDRDGIGQPETEATAEPA
jgi:hypothetical protein